MVCLSPSAHLPLHQGATDLTSLSILINLITLQLLDNQSFVCVSMLFHGFLFFLFFLLFWILLKSEKTKTVLIRSPFKTIEMQLLALNFDSLLLVKSYGDPLKFTHSPSPSLSCPSIPHSCPLFLAYFFFLFYCFSGHIFSVV